MAPGRVHNATTTAALTVAGICATGLLRWPTDYLALCAGLAAGYVLSPDLDLAEGNISLANLRRIPGVGPVLAWVWRVVWWPYGLLVPHRSRLSHLPVFSTAIRFGYLWLWLVLLNIPIRIHFEADTVVGLFVFIGLSVSDLAHWWVDRADTEAKRFSERKSNK